MYAKADIPSAFQARTTRRVKGNRHEHYYYAGWRVIEERDDSDKTLAQTVWSTEYIDAPICRDRNTDVDNDDPNDPNACLDSGGSERYFYHQDANYRVLALTDEDGDVVERYDYDAYGEPRLYAGYDSSLATEVGKLRRRCVFQRAFIPLVARLCIGGG
jgi:hypothetical protein